MANDFSLSRLERLYVQNQPTFDVIPGGNLVTPAPASVGNTDYTRHIRATLDNAVALIDDPSKTGSRSMPIGVVGRKMGNWSASLALRTSGVNGTLPNMDPFLVATMGQAGTIVTTSTKTISGITAATPSVFTTSAPHGFSIGDVITVSGIAATCVDANNVGANGVWVIASVPLTTTFTVFGFNAAAVGGAGSTEKACIKYTLSDSIPYLSMWSFRTPAGLRQRCSHSSVVQQATFTLGPDVADCSFSGQSLWVLDSEYFSQADVYQKAGLSVFPTEPSAPVYVGGIITGFTGKIIANTTNGPTMVTIRNATIRINTGNVMVMDTFNSYYSTGSMGDWRTVTVEFSTYDSDIAAAETLEDLAFSKTPVDMTFQVGTIPGSIVMFYVKQLQLMSPTRSDSSLRYTRDYAASRAHESSLTALDEVTIYIM